MAKLRLALFGAGMIGREHANLVIGHPEAELAGIADPTPAAADYAGRLGAAHFADYVELLDQVRPDGVIVALPNNLHLPAGLACIARRIPCLIEKPVADTLHAARRLAVASEEAGVPVLVGHHRRHSPDIRKARDLVRAGALGRLVTVNGMCLVDKPDGYFEADWRRRAGGGPLLINLIHEVDSLRFICGEIHSVRAFTSNAVRGFEVEDSASVALRFESGALGSFIISDAVASPWAWEFTSGQALYFPEQPGDYLFLGGRSASLSVSNMHLWRHAVPAGNWQDPFQRETVELDQSRAYPNQLDHFLSVVRGTCEPLITARDGMLSLAATIAIAKAASEDRTVEIAEIILADGGS